MSIGKKYIDDYLSFPYYVSKERKDRMRKAAGVLMVIGAFLGMLMFRAIYGFIPGPLGWLPLIWAAFVVAGGFYTFKGKLWKLCLASSILSCIAISTIPILAWNDVLADASGEPINIPYAIFITLVLLTIAILPIISIKLRKTEWES